MLKMFSSHMRPSVAVHRCRSGWARLKSTAPCDKDLPSSLSDVPNAAGDDIQYKSDFLKAMKERGYLHQCTAGSGLDALMAKQKIKAYLGFDATAKSLHVGSLVQLMILRLLQRTGHTPIVLVGGGTSKVGDPSGKDKARQLLSTAEIEANIAHMSKIFSTFLDFKPSDTCSNPAILVNNSHWLNKINYIDFLRDYGRYFSVNRMLTFDSVKTRLAREEPLSFLEFNYMILQAYDFKHLHEKYNATLQIGGSDQWGNIVSGIELVRKSEQAQLYGVTAPLITMSDGKKMGKSESGAVWLDKELLSEFDYWQFWRNVADSDVERFMKLFTELPLEQIRALTAEGGASLNVAKVVLADEATKILHGEECLHKIHRAVGSIYSSEADRDSDDDDDDEPNSLDDVEAYEDPMDAFPEVTFSNKQVLVSHGEGAEARIGVDIGEALMLCRLSASRKEGRRLIKGGGVRVNDLKVDDEFLILDQAYFCNRGRVKLSVGKKRHVTFLVPAELWSNCVSNSGPNEQQQSFAQAAVESVKKVKKMKDKSTIAKKPDDDFYVPEELWQDASTAKLATEETVQLIKKRDRKSKSAGSITSDQASLPISILAEVKKIKEPRAKKPKAEEKTIVDTTPQTLAAEKKVVRAKKGKKESNLNEKNSSD